LLRPKKKGQLSASIKKMLKFTGFLAASPVCIPGTTIAYPNEQSTLEGVLFNPSIVGGGGDVLH